MNKLDLRQIKQSSAANGQAVVWSNTANTWVASSNVALLEVTANNLTVNTNATISGNLTTKALLPSANITYDIGSSTMRYKDLYLAGNTIFLGAIQLKANGESFIIANSTGGTIDTSTGDTDIAGYLNVTSNGYFGGQVNVIGSMQVSNAFFAGNTTVYGFANVQGILNVNGNTVITGNLTVTGTTTYVNTTVLAIADNIVTLNSDVSGAPSENAGIEINRGTSANVALRWNETSDIWETTTDGTTYATIATNNNVTTAYSNAVANAASYTDTKSAAAYSNAASYADGVASNAYANSTTYADNKAANAYSNAVAYAASNTYVNSTFAPLAGGATFVGEVRVSNNKNLYVTNILTQTGTTIGFGLNDLNNIATLAAGNTTVNGYANVSSSVTVGANVLLNTSSVIVGNSSINTQVTSSSITFGNTGGSLVVRASGITFPDSTIQTTAAVDPIVYAIALG